METKTNQRMIWDLPREQVLSEIFDISPYSSDSEEDKSKFSKREQEEIDKIKLKDVKTYYIFYMETDKKQNNICISKQKQKEYFACVLCDEDKDLIMEFEKHFEFNADYIKLPGYYKDSVYRIHNLTKDKLKQEMAKFIKSLGVGYYLDYFSTVKNWTRKY